MHAVVSHTALQPKGLNLNKKAHVLNLEPIILSTLPPSHPDTSQPSHTALP